MIKKFNKTFQKEYKLNEDVYVQNHRGVLTDESEDKKFYLTQLLNNISEKSSPSITFSNGKVLKEHELKHSKESIQGIIRGDEIFNTLTM